MLVFSLIFLESLKYNPAFLNSVQILQKFYSWLARSRNVSVLHNVPSQTFFSCMILIVGKQVKPVDVHWV